MTTERGAEAPREGENAPERKHRLRLTIEVAELYADDLHESAQIMCEPDEPTEEDYRFLVLEEWMREDVALTIVTLPGEKCMNHEFEVVPLRGRIVGVSLDPPVTPNGSNRSAVGRLGHSENLRTYPPRPGRSSVGPRSKENQSDVDGR